jgi:hypothetical protein
MEPKFSDTVTQLAPAIVWGSARPFGNVITDVKVASNPHTINYTMELRVRVKPYKRPLLLGDQVKRYITTPPDVVSVSSQIVVSAKELEHGNAQPNAIVSQVLHRMVRSASTRLYEADPRIGTCDQRYDHMPLFDPPNGLDAMRRIPGCSLCGTSAPDPGGAGYRAWGGGNIGWVHPTCLANVYR